MGNFAESQLYSSTVSSSTLHGSVLRCINFALWWGSDRLARGREGATQAALFCQAVQ